MESKAREKASAERYFGAIGELYVEAIRRDELGHFADALSRILAWMIFNYEGHAVTAEVFRAIGGHLTEFLQRDEAEQAIARCKEEGRPLN